MAAKREIKTTFALDGEAKYRDAVKGINQEQKLLNAELKASSAQFSASGDKQQALASKAQNLSKQIELQKQKIAEAQNAVDQASKRYDAATQALEKLRTEGKEGTAEFERQKKEVEQAEKALTDYKIDVANAEAGLGKMQSQLAQTNKEILLNESRLKKAGEAAEKTGAKMKKVGEKVDKIGTGLTKGVTAPILAAGAGLLKLGEKFDDAVDKIRIGTGATGASLAGLEADFEAVIQKVPAEMDAAAGAIADLNTRLGLSGKPLQDLAQQYLELAHITGQDVTSSITESTRAFQAWKIPAEKYGAGLNTIFKVSQATGIKTTELTQKVTDFAPALQDLGFTFEESAALIGKFEQTGVKTDTVLAALKKSTASFAKEGKNASQGLAEITAKIKAAGTETEAAKIAIEVFGARAGTELAHQIRAGRLDIDAFTKSIAANEETIGKAAQDTYDWKEEWKMLTNQLAIELKPVAQQIFGAVEKATPAIKKIAEFVGDLAEKFGKLSPKQQETILKMIGLTAAAGPLVKTIGKITSGVGSATSTIGGFIKKLGEKKAAEAAAAAASKATAASMDGVGTAATGAASASFSFSSALGAVGITGAVVLAISALSSLVGSIDETQQRVDELVDSIEASSKAYKESTEDTEANAAVANALSDELIALADKENKTNAEKLRMKGLVEELNELVPSLGLEIDDVTGKLNMEADAIKGVIAQKLNEIRLSAQTERLTELYKEQYKIEKELAEAQEEFNTTQADLLDYLFPTEGQLRKVGERYVELEGKLKENKEETALLEQEYAELSTTIGNTSEFVGKSWEKMSDKQRAALLQMLNSTAKSGKKLDKTTQTIVRSLMAEFAKMPKGLSGVGENTMVALGRAILNETSPEKAATAKKEECINAFKKAYGEFEETGTGSANSYAKGVKSGRSSVTTEAGKTKNAAAGEFKKLAGHLEESGLNGVWGLVRGLQNSTVRKVLVSAARALALAVNAAYRQAQKIKSPSKVMEQSGIHDVEGVISGIKKKTPSAKDAAKEMARAVSDGYASETERLAAAQAMLERQIAGSKLSSQLAFSANGLMPGGAVVPPAPKTPRTDQSTHIMVNLNGATIRSDEDVRKLARELMTEADRRKRAKGA